MILLAAAIVIGFGAGEKTVEADQVEFVSMYRMYNPNSGEHFYTGNEVEKDSLLEAGWWCEGTGWVGPSKSDTPVYRMYNPNAGDHHYTTSTGERDYLKRVGWNYEGIGWYSANSSTLPVYREYNPNAKTGAHNYTTNAEEDSMLASVGWKQEGIAWYALGAGVAYEHPEVRVWTEDLSGDITAMDMLWNFYHMGYNDVIRRFGKPDSFIGPSRGVSYGYQVDCYRVKYYNVNYGEFSGTLEFYFADRGGENWWINSVAWYLGDPAQSAEAEAKLRNGLRKNATDISSMWTDQESYGFYTDKWEGISCHVYHTDGTLLISALYPPSANRW